MCLIWFGEIFGDNFIFSFSFSFFALSLSFCVFRYNCSCQVVVLFKLLGREIGVGKLNVTCVIRKEREEKNALLYG